MNILELMIGIKKLDFVLPEFQREYVWTREQAKQLIISLFKDYPTGALLFWKTDKPPDIKNNAVDRTKMGSTHVILDGQQRLTALYLFAQNEIPPYYSEKDIKCDPRNLYFDLLNGEFQYYQKQRMAGSAVWMAITDCFINENVNPFEIAKKLTQEEVEAFQIAQKININLNSLKNVLKKEYPIQNLPPDATIDEAIDVFDRVNSLGTKLTDAELALTHICGKWPQARKEMKNYINELEQSHFYLNLTFMVRALTVIVRGRALFETIHDATKEESMEGWKKLKKIINYLIAILPKHASIHSTENLSSTNVLVPLVSYLSKHGNFDSDITLRRAVHWLYAANTRGRYTSQTDQRLDHDISLILRHDNPWSHLVDEIIDQRGRIEVLPVDIEGRGKGHPFYRMASVLTKVNGGIDWLNGHPLDIKQSGYYEIHSHHIFPHSKLYTEGGYDSRNHIHKKIVNEIANLAFLTADSNWTLSSDMPEKYFIEIKDRYPGALEKQFIPLNPELWKIENYEKFLAERRKLMTATFNEEMKELLEETKPALVTSVKELIEGGENGQVEFKSSMRWDTRRNHVNKDLEKVIAKSITGFLNTNGGTLLIGVDDDGSVLGLENDINSIGRKDIDGFQQKLVQMLVNFLGTAVTTWIRIEFDIINGQKVCAVRIERSQHPVFLKEGNNKEFYIRFGNSTRQLDVEEANQYIADNWG